MKRETRRWLKESHDVDGATERDILDSDARQRAEIRDLKSLLYDLWTWSGCAQELPPDRLTKRVGVALKGKR